MGLCGIFYEAIRPRIINELSVSMLCDVIDIMHRRTAEMSLKDQNTTQFQHISNRILEDVEERLEYRTSVLIRDSIDNYEPSKDDIEYYDFLQNLNQKENPDKVRSSWCPVVDLTLACLSQVYHCVENAVFEFLACEAVAKCVSKLMSISDEIRAHYGDKKGRDHAQLFIIKHLLILREQILPFDVDFSITETTLDFSELTEMLNGLFGNKKYSFIQFLQGSIPVVSLEQSDMKKLMEGQLKKTCEHFIQTHANILIGPLYRIIRLARNDKLPMTPTPRTVKSADGSEIIEESEESSCLFPEHVVSSLQAILNQLESTLMGRLKSLHQLMHLYLMHPVTESILLGPIAGHLQEGLNKTEQFCMQNGISEQVDLDICKDLKILLKNFIDSISNFEDEIPAQKQKTSPDTKAD